MIQSGQFVKVNGLMYLFMGYSDYQRKWCVLADEHGNKREAYAQDVTLY